MSQEIFANNMGARLFCIEVGCHLFKVLKNIIKKSDLLALSYSCSVDRYMHCNANRTK